MTEQELQIIETNAADVRRVATSNVKEAQSALEAIYTLTAEIRRLNKVLETPAVVASPPAVAQFQVTPPPLPVTKAPIAPATVITFDEKE